MKRILINATQNEEIRVALCKGNHLYDFDLENRTREQKKSNIYKGHVTRVEPSLEAVFVEYGSQRQGFLPIREISSEYLSGNPRDENIKKLIKEGDELIVQVEKEERGNKGAALSTYVSLAGRYLVLMPNNPRGGGISRQISGKLREDMKRMLSNLDLAKGMSVIIRTAGIGKTQEDLQHDLNHLLNIWQAIQEQNQKYPSPRLVHQEAGVVTRAVRDYLRDDIAEIWIDNENAYIEAAGFIDAVMPKQAEKLRKYTDYEPMFSRFNIEKQIETAYQREVRLPSGGSIVIDQTEALVSIDINSAKSTKGSDVAETAYHTNLEAADEIARQLRLRDMGGLIVIDFIDMNDNKHQKEVEKRLIDATKYDRARVQFGDISKFGLMEMSRQRLRPSLEESTGYICPRCHGNGMIRDLRSLSLSIMRQIEQIALKERQGEVQAEVPTDIAAFLLNEKRDSLVYLEQDSGTRITILPHAHLESPNFKLHFNRDGFAPSSYERITDAQEQEHSDLGYNVDWQTAEKERPEQQPTRQPRQVANNSNLPNSASIAQQSTGGPQQQNSSSNDAHQSSTVSHSNDRRNHKNGPSARAEQNSTASDVATVPVVAPSATVDTAAQPQAVAWLSNLFAQAPQAQTTPSISSRDAAEAIEALVNTGAQSLGSFGQVDNSALNNNVTSNTQSAAPQTTVQENIQKNDNQPSNNAINPQQTQRNADSDTDASGEDRRRRKPRKSRSSKPHQRKEQRDETANDDDSTKSHVDSTVTNNNADDKQSENQDKRRHDNRRGSNRNNRQEHSRNNNERTESDDKDSNTSSEQNRAKRKSNSQRSSRGTLERGETLTTDHVTSSKNQSSSRRNQDPNEVVLQVNEATTNLKSPEVVHLSLDDSKSVQTTRPPVETKSVVQDTDKAAASQKTIEDKVPQKTSDEKVFNVQSSDKQNTAEQAAARDNESATTTPVSAVKDEDVTVAITEDKVQGDVTEDSKTNGDQASVDESSISKTSTNSHADSQEPDDRQSPTVATVDVVPADTETPQKSQVVNDANDTDSSITSSSNTRSAFELTPQTLFEKHYVTANKFGQASNDPRVVRRHHTQPPATQKLPADAQATTNVPAIRGTVGEFIRATLPEAQERLADEGIINCFIAAVALHIAPAQTAGNSESIVDDADDNPASPSFNFSNYGYQPLATDYLARFETMTQAAAQFAAAQGKTAVEPRAISKRASNDPRGQHAGYKEVAELSVANEQADESNADSSQVEAELLQTDSEVDAHDVQATALTSQMQTEDVSADSEQLLKVAQEVTTNQADIKTTADEQTDIEASDASIVEPSAREDSQAGKSKTTIASYKNMIENVAEQLLPQKGMFNLTTPKVPKSRTRKPKTDHKKPTQAEKLEDDDSDS